MQKLILLLILGLGVWGGCGAPLYRGAGGEDNRGPDLIAVPPGRDSMPVSPATRKLYRYQFKTSDEWQRSPEWFFGNLHHHGIRITEAWYRPSGWYPDTTAAAEAGRAADSQRTSLFPPLLVVGTAGSDRAVTRYQFEPADDFNPGALPEAMRERIVHYVPRQ